MRIHHLRNATCVIESGEHHILIDPLLGAQGELPAFARWRHKPRPNPTVDLPANAASVLEKVTHCLIANHLEALNHCPTRRAALDQVLNDHGLRSKVFIPDDGQTLEIAGDGASTESLADE